MKISVKLAMVMAIVATILMPLLTRSQVYADPNCSASKTLNVVAHTDDDLLFINPDIQDDIDAGKCVQTLYITGGDGGAGLGHVEAREDGVRDAYAYMAGEANSWTNSTNTVNGYTIQISTLNGNEKVSLAFMRLPDGNPSGTGFAATNDESLRYLWYGNTSSIQTLDTAASYTRQQLINTLRSYMSVFAPNIIRSLNYTDTHGPNDHSDHYMAAYFVKEAHQLYNRPHQLIGYRGYDVALSAQNVFGTELSHKEDTFLEYFQHDDETNHCHSLSCIPSEYNDYLPRKYIVSTETRVIESFETVDGELGAQSQTAGQTGKTPASTTFGGSVYTFYYDQANGDLKYSKYNSTTSPAWSFGTIDNSAGADVGQNPSAVVYGNKLYVFYYDATNGDLKLSYSTDGATWSSPVACESPNNVGITPTTIVYDNKLYVFYYDQSDGNLRYQALTGTTCTTPGVIEGYAYSLTGYNGNVGLDTAATIYTQGGGASLQLFTYDAGNGNLRHIWYDGTSWRGETLDGNSTANGRVDANVGINPTVLSTANGPIQLFYRDASNGNLRHAYHDMSTGWHFEILDGDGYAVTRHDADTGATPTVVMQDDTLHVFATDVSAGDIRHYWSSPAQGWQSEVLDGSGEDASSGRTNNSTGEDPTAIVYSGSLHVFYYEGANANLRHATL